MTTLTHPRLTQYQPLPGFAPVASLLVRAMETLRLWHRRARERQRLADLSLYELQDFGASTADRFNELAKPFWRG